LHGGVFGVQDAQGVGVQATACVLVQHLGMGLQMLDQGLSMAFALFGLTEAVEVQLDPAQTQ
jgi:hypothetical protein